MHTDLLYQVNALARATGWPHWWAFAHAARGIAVFAVLVVVAWWMARRTAETGQLAAVLCAGASVLLTLAANQPLVVLIARPRSYTAHPDRLILAGRGRDWSFPPDHATTTGAGAGAVGRWFVSRWLGLWACLAATVMVLARSYSGAHAYVAAGLGLAAIVAATVSLLAQAGMGRHVGAVHRTRFRPLLVAVAPA